VLWSLWGCTIGQPMGKLDRPPAAAIITPEDGAVLMESVELVGKVVDPDGLDDLVSVSWRSDLDGELGEAPPDDDGYTRLTTSLSAGIHTLELSVTDSTELEARADITVTVGIPCVEGVLELVPEGPDTQIHVFGAPDPDGVWVAWNQPDGAGLFDVWVQHLGCDGQVDVGPLQLDDGADNEIDPAVAVSGNRVLVAWQSDNGLGQDNLDVRWRLLGRGPCRRHWCRTMRSCPRWWPPLAGGGSRRCTRARPCSRCSRWSSIRRGCLWGRPWMSRQIRGRARPGLR
jgi:hypothetical protein